MVVMSFLTGLPSEFETVKSQILSKVEISSLQDVFSRVLCTESVPPSALISRHNSESGRLQSAHSTQGYNTSARLSNSRDIICHYCNKPGHMKRDCQKLLNKNQKHPERTHNAHVASKQDTSGQEVLISAEDFARFSQYQDSFKASSNPSAVMANSGNSNTCLISSSSKFVIDSGATDHMSGPYDEEDYW